MEKSKARNERKDFDVSFVMASQEGVNAMKKKQEEELTVSFHLFLRFSESVKLNYDLNNNKLEPFHYANLLIHHFVRLLHLKLFISRFAVI